LRARPPSLYRIHGLLVESEIPLQAQRVDGDTSDRAVNLGSGSASDPVPDYRLVAREPRECPHSAPPGRILAEFRDHGFGYWVAEARDPRQWTLRYAGICEVTLDRRRRTIAVHRSPEADPGLIPVFLEGSVLAHALAAEGLLVLHASAVEVGGAALAIVGPSGAGKSTLAALLCAAGARLVADDALRVDATRSGAMCFPGSRRLRLRLAAASLGRMIEGASVGETADGRTAVIPARPADAPLKVRAALVPEPSREAKRLQMRRLGAMDGLQELLRHPRLTMWQASGPIAQLFEMTAEVAAQLPVYRAKVPWGPPFPPRLAEELLASAGLDASVPESTDSGDVSTSARRGAD
jgi:hypothetical protein